MNSYVIIEGSYKDHQKLTIIDRDPRKVKFKAILQSCDTPNRNGRIYPKEEMAKAIDQIRDRIRDKTFGGELDHPIVEGSSETDWIRHVTFLYKEASHAITEIHFEGNLIVGTVETLSTPNGRTLAGLINDGVKVGFSLRAISDNIEKTSRGDIVRSPITMISYDVVSFPSHAEAYIKEITQVESVQIPKCENGRCMLSEHLMKYKSSSIMLSESHNSNTYYKSKLFPGFKLNW